MTLPKQIPPVARVIDGGPANSCSLRDYFAGQALVGLTTKLASSPDGPPEEDDKAWNEDNELIAWRAYTLADAMLKEGGK